MSFFQRLFKLGQAELNDVLSKLEDPIKIAEQAVLDLKEELYKAKEAVAEVKSLSIAELNSYDNCISKAKAYEGKAIQALQLVNQGNISQEKADELATEALIKKAEASSFANKHYENHETFEQSLTSLNANVNTLKVTIAKWENELITLKSRLRVSETTKHLNKQMVGLGTSGSVEMLQRMQNKVEEAEALAEAYGEIASNDDTVNAEIDQVVYQDEVLKRAQQLKNLKQKMGITKAQQNQ